MDRHIGNRIIALRDRVVEKFNSGNWEELGFLTGSSDVINNHPRLLRSMRFGDDDYSGHALSVLGQMIGEDLKLLEQIESFVRSKFPEEGVFISDKPAERKMTFAPTVFHVPPVLEVERDLVTVMMPFAGFTGTHTALKKACADAGFRCIRADDIWEHATIIQDIFNLIVRARAVIVDFSGKNPNVMYETGIAHTLGKLVIPITQSLEDVPFDIRHHRVLKYLPNNEGYDELHVRVTEKLRQVE